MKLVTGITERLQGLPSSGTIINSWKRVIDRTLCSALSCCFVWLDVVNWRWSIDFFWSRRNRIAYTIAHLSLTAGRCRRSSSRLQSLRIRTLSPTSPTNRYLYFCCAFVIAYHFDNNRVFEWMREYRVHVAAKDGWIVHIRLLWLTSIVLCASTVVLRRMESRLQHGSAAAASSAVRWSVTVDMHHCHWLWVTSCVLWGAVTERGATLVKG